MMMSGVNLAVSYLKPTYEGLKVGGSSRNKTPVGYLKPTYEGLKGIIFVSFIISLSNLKPTYEGLKVGTYTNRPAPSLAFKAYL